MFDLLWIPVSFLGVLFVYNLLRARSVRKDRARPAKVVPPAARPAGPTSDASAKACVRIMEITPTNNSYDPMGDVLASLELDQVRELLGGPLHASMEGYML